MIAVQEQTTTNVEFATRSTTPGMNTSTNQDLKAATQERECGRAHLIPIKDQPSRPLTCNSTISPLKQHHNKANAESIASAVPGRSEE